MTVRQMAFLGGTFAAQESTVHPAALAETVRAIATGADGIVRVPGHREFRVGWTNGGDWWTVDGGDWGRSVSRLHFRGDEDRTMELVALAYADGGHLNAAALAAGLKMAPIVVTHLPEPTHRASELADVSAWVGLALIERRNA